MKAEVLKIAHKILYYLSSFSLPFLYLNFLQPSSGSNYSRHSLLLEFSQTLQPCFCLRTLASTLPLQGIIFLLTAMWLTSPPSTFGSVVTFLMQLHLKGQTHPYPSWVPSSCSICFCNTWYSLICYIYYWSTVLIIWSSLMAQLVKNPLICCIFPHLNVTSWK